MIQIDHLSFGYGRKQELFDQLSITLPLGNIYGLLGKNGAGKSTLLKLITGLLFPNQGMLNVVGYQPKDRYPQFLQEIYLITEEFHLPSMKMNNFVRLYSPFYPRFNHQLFEEYIKEFDIPMGQKLARMSYGQKKNFLLSFGLATDCKLLILDEPTNGLDIPSKSKFRKIVANAIHEDRSFIISTHQVRDMENLIDPIIILDEGEVVLYQYYEEVAKKLAFHRQLDISNNSNLVYAEPSMGGYTVVTENIGMEETNMNLEVLFNAVVSNKEKIHEIFND